MIELLSGEIYLGKDLNNSDQKKVTIETLFTAPMQVLLKGLEFNFVYLFHSPSN